MVGTSISELIFFSSIVASTSAGSNRAETKRVPPLMTVGTKNAAPACESGVHIRNRGFSGHSHSASWTWLIVFMAWTVPITPFGLPVVPPV